MEVTGAATRGRVDVPEQVLVDQLAALRRSWLDVASEVAPDGVELRRVLEGRLDELSSLEVPAEHDLLRVAEDAAQVALQLTTAEGARVLSRRLRRAVYEFLLAVDAAAARPPTAVTSLPVTAAPARRRGAVMIGLEEIAGMASPPTVDAAPELHGPPATLTEVPAPGDAGEPSAALTEAPAGWDLDEARAAMAEAPAAWDLDEPPDTALTAAAAPMVTEAVEPEEPPASSAPAEHLADVSRNGDAAMSPWPTAPAHADTSDAGALADVVEDIPVPLTSALLEGDGEGDWSRPSDLLLTVVSLRDAAHELSTHEPAPEELDIHPGDLSDAYGSEDLSDGAEPVVPSYRAWADVLASSTAAADEETAKRAHSPQPSVQRPQPPGTPRRLSRLASLATPPAAAPPSALDNDPIALPPGPATLPAESVPWTPAEVPHVHATPGPWAPAEAPEDHVAPTPWAPAEARPAPTPWSRPEAPEGRAPTTPPAAPEGHVTPTPWARPEVPQGHVAPAPRTRPEVPREAPAAEQWPAPAERPVSLRADLGWERRSWMGHEGTAAVPHFPPSATPSSSPPSAPEPSVGHEATDSEAQDASGWSVRPSPRQQLLAERMAELRRRDVTRAAVEALDDAPSTRGRRRRGREPMRLSREQVPALVDELLRRKKGAEAAALLQRAAQELAGRDIAELALDGGDRCRALGQTRAALNCYLAGWRADPLNEAALWRLADTCLADRAIDLAVGYMERIADLMRARGDDDGALVLYRKMATVAPDRVDIRDVLRSAQSTGHLPD